MGTGSSARSAGASSTSTAGALLGFFAFDKKLLKAEEDEGLSVVQMRTLNEELLLIILCF